MVLDAYLYLGTHLPAYLRRASRSLVCVAQEISIVVGAELASTESIIAAALLLNSLLGALFGMQKPLLGN